MLHGRARPFSRTRGGPVSPADFAQAWQAAVIANGGTVSAGRLVIVNNFITAEMAAGTWALSDDYWALWAENVPQAVVSLKQLRIANPVSAPNFTADRGYLFDGVVSYLNTGFIPLTHGVAMTGSLLRIGVYERTELSATGYSAGGYQSSTANLVMRNRSGLTGLNCTVTVFTAASSLGLWVGTRTAGPTFRVFYRGVQSGAALAPTSNATTLGNQAVYIGARNNAGTADLPRAASVGFMVVGAPLSDAQELQQYNNIQTWATAVGAQV